MFGKIQTHKADSVALLSPKTPFRHRFLKFPLVWALLVFSFTTVLAFVVLVTLFLRLALATIELLLALKLYVSICQTSLSSLNT